MLARKKEKLNKNEWIVILTDKDEGVGWNTGGRNDIEVYNIYIEPNLSTYNWNSKNVISNYNIITDGFSILYAMHTHLSFCLKTFIWLLIRFVSSNKRPIWCCNSKIKPIREIEIERTRARFNEKQNEFQCFEPIFTLFPVRTYSFQLSDVYVYVLLIVMQPNVSCSWHSCH